MITRRQFSIGSMLSVAGASIPLPRAFAQGAAAATPGYGAPTYYLPMLDLKAAYPKDFPHWNYVRPDAPKGGKLVLGVFGSFDTLNNMTTDGTDAAGVGAINDALITANLDELDTYYADAAESFVISDDKLSIIFTMRDGLHFHDGHPMTAEDVAYTHQLLREKGALRFRARFYDDMASIEALDERRVRFTAKNLNNPQLLKAMASFPILPKHWWEGRDFGGLTMEPPLGSGAYKIKSVDPGRSITLQRVEGYWGEGLPQNIGSANFDEITYQYYRDQDVLYEALKSGEFDFMAIGSPQQWTTGFKSVPAVQTGALKLEEIPDASPQFYLGMMFNLRRPYFSDVRVRRALNYFYDFETTQKTNYYGLYSRIHSYFPNTPFSFSGLPEGRELEILERYRGKIADEIFTTEFKQPTTDGNGNIRANLRAALDLLKQAGWESRGGKLTNTTGQVMAFEIVYTSPETEKTILPFVENLRRAGIQASPRLMDVPQFRNRINNFEFDLMPARFVPFFPPGEALRGGWNSRYADRPGDENSQGVKDPIIDELVEMIIAAKTYDEKAATCKAFDRYATWQFFSIGLYEDPVNRIAYWDMFGHPDTRPKNDVGFPSTWWFDGKNPKALRGQRR
ncbi:extracellular solute-binding protein [Inquilinus limosus]|uniref:Solute-binding protein family 5 domain-containing protein n=1 Tax=Inquilinus limosus TaxID=171674 RepID=A0A211ZGT7_9PROT|nr:extracellular solute-binding protein [Inquilinus limosus]OWJ64317.1 hypothetical protein BWR60_25460 [Inquilinus limosus]